jgi:hypothetical protein
MDRYVDYTGNFPIIEQRNFGHHLFSKGNYLYNGAATADVEG